MRSSKIFITIIIVVVSLTGILLYYFYSTLSYKQVDPFGAIPKENVVAILRVKSFNQLHQNLADTSLTNNDLFNTFLLNRSKDVFSAIEVVISKSQDTTDLSSFKNRSFLISCHKLNDSTLHYIYHFSLKNRLETTNLLALLNENSLIVKELNSDNVELFRFEFQKGFPLYLTINKGIASISFNKNLIKNSFKQQSSGISILSNERLNHLVKTSKNSDFDNLFLFSKGFKDIGLQMLPEEWHEHLATIRNEDTWAQYDIDYKKRQLTFNGIFVCSEDTLFTNIFKNGATQLTLDKVYPSSVTSFFNYTFHSSHISAGYRDFLRSNAAIKDSSTNEVDSDSMLDLWLKGVEPEFGMAFLSIDSSLILKRAIFQKVTNQKEITKNIILLQSQLGDLMTIAENWTVDNEIQIPIYKGIDKDFTTKVYGRFFTTQPSNYMIIFDGFIVFADELSVLKHIYIEYLRGNTLYNNLNYKEYRQKFSNKENFFIYSKTKSGSFVTKANVKTRFNNSSVNLFGTQLVYSDSIAYSTVVLDFNVKQDNFKDVDWSCFLDTSIVRSPKIVFNNSDNGRFILVQDANNQLYLINTIGRIIWKKPLDGRVSGEIRLLMLKDSDKFNFLFNTDDKIYQLDFEGNNVGNFPVLLPSKATSTLSVFDYENNGDFRIFIPSEDKEIRVYDKKGNLVTGFQTTRLSSELVLPIQHFVVSGKDYILLNDGYASRILDRKGNERILLSKPIDQNQLTPFYLASEGITSFFVTSDLVGNIVKISIPTGVVTLVKGLDTSSDHVMFPILMKDKTYNYFFVTNNTLKMVSRDGAVVYEKEFQISQLSELKLFSPTKFGNFISFFDKSRSMIYLFNVDCGEVVKGFPKNGGRYYSVEFLSDGTPQLYFGTNNNSIVRF